MHPEAGRRAPPSHRVHRAPRRRRPRAPGPGSHAAAGPAPLALPPGAAPAPALRPARGRCASATRRSRRFLPGGLRVTPPPVPPSALRPPRRAFPSTGPVPSSAGRPGDRTLPRTGQLSPSQTPDKRSDRKLTPNCNAQVRARAPGAQLLILKTTKAETKSRLGWKGRERKC